MVLTGSPSTWEEEAGKPGFGGLCRDLSERQHKETGGGGGGEAATVGQWVMEPNLHPHLVEGCSFPHTQNKV